MNSAEEPFKSCAMCLHSWRFVCDFIEDKTIELNGYQADFEDPSEGLIIVTHNTDNCGSTLGVKASKLAHLYSGPIYTNHNMGKPSCSGKCQNEHDFSPCNEACNMRWIREVMQMIKSHHCPVDLIDSDSFVALPIAKR